VSSVDQHQQQRTGTIDPRAAVSKRRRSPWRRHAKVTFHSARFRQAIRRPGLESKAAGEPGVGKIRKVYAKVRKTVGEAKKDIGKAIKGRWPKVPG